MWMYLYDGDSTSEVWGMYFLIVLQALVDLQLHMGCNVRFVETPAEVADIVAMFTKSVAETPFK